MRAQEAAEYEFPPILYSASTPTNAASLLDARLAAGEWVLPRTDAKSCLRNLLDAFDVPVESQVLVFSKTSLQRRLIEPQRPRAVYFADDAYLGWVPGGLFEIAVTDPRLGLVFYRLDGRAADRPPRLDRDEDCLSCHAGSLTRNWPGMMVRSVYPDARGEPITSAGSFLVGHDTPFEERWGGWYVTGRHGAAQHLGNAIARESERGASLDPAAGANLTDLGRFFDTSHYLRADSDIVALMVLEHQVGMHNRLVQGALRARKWLHYQQQLQRELGQPVREEPEGTALRVVEGEAERIVEHLLFCDETTLPEGGIQGAGAFEAAFRRNRQPDPEGRSLKDFDLRSRLFTYRCSYMIYSKAFAALPPPLATRVCLRLDQILGAADPPKRFAHLPAAERHAIRQILRATHPGFTTVTAAPTR